MTTDIDINTTTSLTSVDDGEESSPLCFSVLSVIKHATLGVAILIMTTTLIVIPGHRRLRKQHHIFPYNLVLSDLCGAIIFAISEGTNELPQEIVKLRDILGVASLVVSLLSVVLVTGYQFITIRVDPFGALNIITTPRLIATCVVTWALSLSISSTIVEARQDHLYIFLLCIALTTTIITGFCYVFIYRSVAMVPCDGKITRQRKEENQRVIRTFGLVFGTTVLCWICPWVNWAFLSFGVDNGCLFNAGDIMICVNWIANSIIYWWRLKEFRAMFAFCMKSRRTEDVQMIRGN